jgi:putative ABC transport system ATP-binding protein
VLDILSEVNRKGRSVVMVTHDVKSALRGDRIVYLEDGSLRGECGFEKYAGADERRNEKLLAFLKDMGW